MREEVFSSMRQTFVTLSNVAGLRRMTYFPYTVLQKTARTAANSVGRLKRTDDAGSRDPADPGEN